MLEFSPLWIISYNMMPSSFTHVGNELHNISILTAALHSRCRCIMQLLDLCICCWIFEWFPYPGSNAHFRLNGLRSCLSSFPACFSSELPELVPPVLCCHLHLGCLRDSPSGLSSWEGISSLLASGPEGRVWDTLSQPVAQVNGPHSPESPGVCVWGGGAYLYCLEWLFGMVALFLSSTVLVCMTSYSRHP